MGVKLHWQVEHGHGRTQQDPESHHEDPQDGRKRRGRMVRFVAVVGIFIGLIALGGWLVMQRLSQLEERAKQLLADTVQAEVAYLRIGDNGGFMRLQESAGADWVRQQLDFFYDTQSRKSTTDLTLSGRIVSLEIDGRRGRVQVEEIENGTPYIRTWFYWRYDATLNAEGDVEKEAGWYHVPPDYTFWGESRTVTTARFMVRYSALDELFATAFTAEINEWFEWACSFLDCNQLPFWTIDIVSNPAQRLTLNGNAQLIIPSPYLQKARADLPFDMPLQIDVAGIFATQWVDVLMLPPQVGYDSAFIRDSAIKWLIGRWVSVDAQAYLLDSFARLYGDSRVATLLNLTQPTSDMSVLSGVAGADIAQVGLDWRDFIAWRLQTENSMIQQRDEAGFVRLYDTRFDEIRLKAYERFNANQLMLIQEIVSVTPQNALDGTAQLLVIVRLAERDEAMVFQWVGGVWLRAS